MHMYCSCAIFHWCFVICSAAVWEMQSGNAGPSGEYFCLIVIYSNVICFILWYHPGGLPDHKKARWQRRNTLPITADRLNAGVFFRSSGRGLQCGVFWCFWGTKGRQSVWTPGRPGIIRARWKSMFRFVKLFPLSGASTRCFCCFNVPFSDYGSCKHPFW